MTALGLWRRLPLVVRAAVTGLLIATAGTGPRAPIWTTGPDASFWLSLALAGAAGAAAVWTYRELARVARAPR
jgi:hypothetical protein